MKKKIFVFVLTLSLVLSLVAFPASAADTLSGKTVLAFGDSLTQGTAWYAERYDTYVDILADAFPSATFINAGVRGDSTYNATVRFEKDVLAKNPDVVLICFGMNDQAWEIGYDRPIQTLDRYITQLEGFIKPLQQKGVDVILVTPNPVNKKYYKPNQYNDYGYGLMDTYCNAMRALALKYGCGLVDMNCEITLDGIDKHVSTDGIHQTVEGHKFYAECIGNYLKAVYQNQNKGTLSLNCTCDGRLISSQTVTGAVGANVILPAPEIFAYKADTEALSGKIGTGGLEYKYSPLEEIPLSVGASYTVDGTKHASLNQDDGVRLTDGKKGAGDGGSNYYSGYTDSDGIEITVDLGEAKDTNKYTIYAAGGTWGISPPHKVTVSVSQNGTEFKDLGEAKVAKSATGEGGWSLYQAVLEVKGEAVSARYIKFSVTAGVNNHFWLDEVEAVYNTTLTETETPPVTDPEIKVGDLNGNGKIDATEVAQVRLMALGKITPNEKQLKIADINGSGKVDASDAARVRLHYLNKASLPNW